MTKRDQPHILVTPPKELPRGDRAAERRLLVEQLGPQEVEGVFKQPMNPVSINMASWGGEERIERLQKGLARALLDESRNQRLTSGFCKSCYYLHSTVAGQASSDRPCKRWGCHARTKWSNTDVPNYCTECSKEFGICRRCGSDLEYKARKSLSAPKRK